MNEGMNEINDLAHFGQVVFPFISHTINNNPKNS